MIKALKAQNTVLEAENPSLFDMFPVTIFNL
jgi:hypothetical protein